MVVALNGEVTEGVEVQRKVSCSRMAGFSR
jgi:hypothetical protein